MPTRLAPRQRLLQAAFRRFVQQGYHGTSVRQIARDAGMTPGNLYNYFASKEHLFAAVLATFHPYREFLPLLERALAQGVEDLGAFVLELARQVERIFQQQPDVIHLLLIEMVEFQNRHVLPIYEREILPRLEALQRHSPALRVPYSPAVLLRGFLGLMMGYHLLRTPHSEARLEDFVSLFLYGALRNPSGEVCVDEHSTVVLPDSQGDSANPA